MGIPEIISLFSGVALFLFGMSLMGEGLKKVSGDKLEPILFKVSGTQLKGVLFGTGVTAVIQSSAATSVMAVGFVNSGIMKLRQAISVIIGSILGTSITGWVICLSYIDGTEGIASLLSTKTLTGLAAVIGILLRMFSKKRTGLYTGNILMGFSILMFGMSTMSGSVSALGKAPWFLNLLTSMRNPVLGILVGVAITAMLQSASAAVGILQALSLSGAMTLDSALPLLMGVAIGASAPVLLSAIGASVNGKRAALVYLVASAVGVLACCLVFYPANAILHFGFMSNVMNPFNMAAVNSFLRLGMTIVLMPLTGLIETVVIKAIPEKPDEERQFIQLEERFLDHPALAIEQVRQTIDDMANVAGESIQVALGLFKNFDEAGFNKVTELEDMGDKYEDALGTYLSKLTAKTLSTEQSRQVSKYLHVLSDFERITDHARNIAENAKEKNEKNVIFSGAADHEMNVITHAVFDIMELTTGAFIAEDVEGAKEVEPLEEIIDGLCDEMKMHHVERVQEGTCTILQGFIFNDILTNLERVSDHCSNIAVAMINLSQGNFETHEYLDHLKEKETDAFRKEVNAYAEKYKI